MKYFFLFFSIGFTVAGVGLLLNGDSNWAAIAFVAALVEATNYRTQGKLEEIERKIK